MLMSEVGLHQGTVLLRTHPQVYDPLVEPGGFEGPRSHFRDRAHGVHRAEYAAKGAEAVFRPGDAIGVAVRVARVHRCANPGEDEDGDKVRLMERIHVGVSGHVATHTQEAVYRVKSQAKVRHPAVLDMLVLGGIGQKVGPTLAYGTKPLQLLGEGLRTEKRRLDQELREVGSVNGAVARDNLSTEQVLRRD